MTGLPPAANPDRACPHPDFAAFVEVNRLTAHDRITSCVPDDDPPVIGYSADIRVTCLACGEAFRWTGVPAGLSPARPTCSVDETTLHAPLRPASADPDFGLGLPGFSITYREGDPT